MLPTGSDRRRRIMVYIKHGRSVKKAESVEAVAVWWDDYRDALVMNGGGGSRALGNGVTVYADRECKVEVAKVSYNGRIWPVQVAA
jgi:hypothetical protein